MSLAAIRGVAFMMENPVVGAGVIAALNFVGAYYASIKNLHSSDQKVTYHNSK